MTAQIIQFPMRNGAPNDPLVGVFRQAFAERGDPMTLEEARTFTRQFADELDRLHSVRMALAKQSKPNTRT